MSAFTAQDVNPDKIFVLLDGGIYFELSGVKSRCQVDVDYYDGSTHSKIVDAAMLGCAHSIVTQQENSKAAQTSPTPALAKQDFTNGGVTDSVFASNFPVSGKSTYGGIGGPTTTVNDQSPSGFPSIPALDGAETSYAPVVNTDSAFRVGADDLVPGITKKTLSFIQFWSGEIVTGAVSGKLVGEYPLADYRGWSPNKPANVN